MKMYKYIISTIVLLSCLQAVSFSQDSTKPVLNLSLGYFNDNGRVQYLKANAKTKADGKFKQVASIKLNFYITSEDPAHLLGKGVTNENGEAVLFIPPTAKDEWNSAATHSFIVSSEASKQFDAASGTADVTKAKIQIDTAEGRNITATVLAFKDSSWQPMKDVELKIAVKRMDGDLNVNETQTYTTDSTGAVTAEFKHDSLPGDAKGNLVLVARIEESDLYGSITAEKTVPWGKYYKYESEYDKRTLFARRGQSPVWLEFMAYTIIIGVWVVLLYLIGQIRKLKKLGTV